MVIPAYDAADTLFETPSSLRQQACQRWEAIVIDDGSSDETLATATRFGEQDDRIRVFSQPHRGASAARNKGIGLVRFEWLLFLDADDWVCGFARIPRTNK